MSSDRNVRENTVKVKLPKLIIIKFEGTNSDWLRFWSQFEIEIDRADITTVSKFSNLQELVILKEIALAGGLPFNTKGYEKAKASLKAKFGKPSKVINTYIQCIMSSSIIT